MYDKVTLWIDRAVIGVERFERLKWFADGKNWFRAESIYLRFTEHSIRCTGSLAKWFEGSNLNALTHAEAVEVIDDFCRLLDLDPSEVRVSGVEFGGTYEVSQPPSRYLELLGELPRAKRLSVAKGAELQTLNYQSTAQTPTFCHTLYDKGAEMNIEGNLLRFELRYRKKMAQTLGVKGGVWLSTLREGWFFRKLQERSMAILKQIKKMGQIDNAPETIKGVKDGYEMLFGQLLGGDPTIIERHIKSLKRLRVYKYPKEYSLLKSKLNKAVERWGRQQGDNPQLITEFVDLVEREMERCKPLCEHLE
ncbi:MAG: hypothetical protein R3Y68_06345 [Rikenellaceae bacterium]